MASLAFYLLFAGIVGRVTGGNWAQSSGYFEQNVVIPNIPSPVSPHWQARFGHVVVVVPGEDAVDAQGTLLILGGDTYANDFSDYNVQPGVYDRRWGNGYKNDVWSSKGTIWDVRGDDRVRNGYKQKLPEATSFMEWSLIQPGLRPNPRQTYDDWIVCEDYFAGNSRYEEQRAEQCGDDDDSTNVMWSPRRHHGGVYFNGYVYIMGGRAREIKQFSEERTVGGILGPRVQEIPDILQNRFQLQTTVREASVYKSDVWRSIDGDTWELVTPGCRAPQSSLIADGNDAEGKHGIKENECTSDADCTGSEICDDTLNTCVCNMWSPREQFAVEVYEDFMYVVGGFTSVLFSDINTCGPYACGDTDASSYRYYLSDVWYSADGESWTLITENAFDRKGRGGHQMLLVPDLSGNPYMWVFGGRGGSITGGDEIEYFNEIWVASIPSSGILNTFESLTNTSNPDLELWARDEIPWEPRSGHTVALEPASPLNLNTRFLYVVGGTNGLGGDGRGPVEVRDTDRLSHKYDTENGAFLRDVWTWRLDIENEPWRKDFTSDEIFLTATETGFEFKNNSPAIHYVTPDSNVTELVRWWVPDDVGSYPSDRTRYEERTLIDDEKMTMLNSQGIFTIRDLANADLYTILRLRGFDFPQVPVEERLTYGDDICEVRVLAESIVEKCSVQTSNRNVYAGERNQPWNIFPIFGGPPPATQHIEWHDRPNYDFMISAIDDPTTVVSTWNGCDPIDVSGDPVMDILGPDVNGIGHVTIPQSVRDPRSDADNLFCVWTPGPRAYHASAFYEGRLYLFGGKSSEQEFLADSWYRENTLPSAVFFKKPSSRTSGSLFRFNSNKPGCSFEYRVWDFYRHKEIRPWTPVVGKTNVEWLNWRVGGPGGGRYTLYVRAVDPAGNRDEEFILGLNVHVWRYVSPIPYDIIFGVIAALIGIILLSYLEYRRRVKKAAMERYAMKRMRRKFKAMQRDIDARNVDWRTLYMESKATEAVGKRKKDKKKKENDKKAEKRDKERAARDKEKDRLKKKLKGARTSGPGADSAVMKTEQEKQKEKDKMKKDKKDKKKKKKKKDKNQFSIIDEDGPLESPGGGEEKRLKDYESSAMNKNSKGKVKRLKDYEVPEQEKAGSGKPKYKDYEVEAKGGSVDEGAKQRKQKKFKDYEMKSDDQGDRIDKKKNM
jgi:hypothetical protein